MLRPSPRRLYTHVRLAYLRHSRVARLPHAVDGDGARSRHELVPIGFADSAHRSQAYLAINPNGPVPAIDDGGFILRESLAINLSLAKKHSTGGLYPATLEGEAHAWQWSF